MNVLSINMQKKLIFLGVMFGLGLVPLSSVTATDLMLSPMNEVYTEGETFSVLVTAVPEDEQLERIATSLQFDPAILTVVSVVPGDPEIANWNTAPSFSNTGGTITYDATFSEPLSDTTPLFSITFRASQKGATPLLFSSGSAVRAAGAGNSSVDTYGSAYEIEAAENNQATTSTIVEEDTAATTPIVSDPTLPIVQSLTFSDPSKWYNTNRGLFVWDVGDEVERVAAEIGTSSTYVPETVYNPPIDNFDIGEETLSDGSYFMSVQFRIDGVWGSVANIPFNIDMTAPEDLTVSVNSPFSSDGFPHLAFAARDSTSGISYYEIHIDNRAPIILPSDIAAHGYLFSDIEDGNYSVRVVAYDQAGNSIDRTVSVPVTAGWIDPLNNTSSPVPLLDVLFGLSIWTWALLAVILLLIWYLISAHLAHTKREALLHKETKDIQMEMEKIFSALRDEIYDQIVNITKRPRLTKGEQSAVLGLNKALEVSETLIEKEINDVKKILK